MYNHCKKCLVRSMCVVQIQQKYNAKTYLKKCNEADIYMLYIVEIAAPKRCYLLINQVNKLLARTNISQGDKHSMLCKYLKKVLLT